MLYEIIYLARLREENAELKKATDIENSFIRHAQPYLMLDGEKPKTYYCSSFPKWIKVRNSLISTLLMNAIPIQDGVFILKARSAKDYLTLS